MDESYFLKNLSFVSFGDLVDSLSKKERIVYTKMKVLEILKQMCKRPSKNDNLIYVI